MTSSASTPHAAPVAPSLPAAPPAPAPVSPAPPRRPATGAGPGRAHLSRARRVWAETWRLGLATLVGLLAFALVWPETATADWSDARLGLGMMGDLAVGVATLVLVAFRHRAPFVIALILALCGGVSTLATGAAVLGLVSLATRRRARELATVGLVYLAAGWFSESVMFPAMGDSLPAWQLLLSGVVLYALVVAVGAAIGSRRDLIASLRDRAVLAEHEQALREERVRDHERARIAREMHDVLGHRLSLVALHAGALEYRGRDLSPDEVVETAGVVRDNAQSALSELRDVLGVLRDPSTTGESEVTQIAPPQPTLADLSGLLDEARAAGAVVACTIDDRTTSVLVDLPTSLSRHAYRIVQESLTNARRHAPAQPVDIAFTGAAGGTLRIVVGNPSIEHRASAPGHGLTGLAERVRLVGGTFQAGPDGHGRHVVEAVLPWS
ncbi:sensor histidine kinase [Frigoribacterium sp. CFBP9030]|uniref:sensor histidine kinase n=1 Tax=Frigoribacterium sp. CFBP9030 TaxID=3096537 RepID=UPI002A69FA58|nr:histidine kinase [Frigoribacterium sp. CFBP9030]MDY0892379.1 histidine kinase [Frigoribacterium sp. CFBP9030]